MLNATWLKQIPKLHNGRWHHGWTTVEGPDFKVCPESSAHANAAQQVATKIGLPSLSWVHQIHGGQVSQATRPGFAGQADALWTNKPGLGVLGRSADCPLILLGGQNKDGTPIWGFAHASWRSTILKITGNLVEAMVTAGALPPTFDAVICPSAGPCCYEVGPEVRRAALTSLGPGSEAFFLERNNGLYLDLWKANIAQLTSRGVLPENIHTTGICTICDGLDYPSYRRQGDQAGRFVAVIGAT